MQLDQPLTSMHHLTRSNFTTSSARNPFVVLKQRDFGVIKTHNDDTTDDSTDSTTQQSQSWTENCQVYSERR